MTDGPPGTLLQLCNYIVIYKIITLQNVNGKTCPVSASRSVSVHAVRFSVW